MIGADIVDVDSRATADVFDVGAEIRDSHPSVCLELRPLELLPVVLSRVDIATGGASRSLRGRGDGCGDGVALLRGDMEREGIGDGVTPGAALDFLGGGKTAFADTSAGLRLASSPTPTAARSSTIDSKRPSRSFAPRSSL